MTFSFQRLTGLRAAPKAVNLLRSFWQWQPFTFRGVAALLTGVVTIQTLALPESDLVAYILGGGLLGITALLLIGTVITRIRLSRSMKVEAFFDPHPILSQVQSPSGLVLQGSSLPVFFHLSVSREFDRPGVLGTLHIVKGRQPDGGRRHLIDAVKFPHRGLWGLESVRVAVHDGLGFTSLWWQVPQGVSIEVSAPTIDIEPLPVLAASARIGDQLSRSTERAGDLFDIKSYDPSDGVKRILWKTYAKSGQLMVRRPEPAVIPEGEVAVYLVAEKEQDYVAGALQSYLQQLFRQDMAVLFGTDGAAETKGSLDRSGAVKRDPGEIQRLINSCVWSKDVGTGLGFSHFLTALSETNRPVDHVIVFAPQSAKMRWAENISNTAKVFDTHLTVALVEDRLAGALRAAPGTTEILKQAVYTRVSRARAQKHDTLAALARTGAEVIVCQKSHFMG